MSDSKKYDLFINPAGFIELHYIGTLNPQAVINSTKKLQKLVKKLKATKTPILILVDVTKVPITNNQKQMAPARKHAVDVISTMEYKRIAIYGSVVVQIVMNTVALIAGKRNKVRVFASRVEALKWLKS
jgi:hypothetical protein